LLREAADPTARTDAACRAYLISTPLNMLASDHVSLNIAVSVPSSFDFVYISSISIILSPSTTTTALGEPPAPDPALTPDPLTSAGSKH